MKRVYKFLILIITICVVLTCSYNFLVYSPDNEAIERFDKSIDKDPCYIFEPDNPKAAIIFYQGALVDYRAYAPLMDELSNNGIVAIIRRLPYTMTFRDLNLNKIKELYPNIEKWYLGGHSLGGYSISSYYYKNIDEYDGLILLASYSQRELNDTNKPVLTIVGSLDGVINSERLNSKLETYPDGSGYVLIEGGNHSQFANYGLQRKDNEASISSNEQRKITVKTIYDFIDNNE